MGMLGGFFTLALVACNKKADPAVANAGGGVSSKSVLTMKGAAR